jgi:hypothetical protein
MSPGGGQVYFCAFIVCINTKVYILVYSRYCFALKITRKSEDLTRTYVRYISRVRRHSLSIELSFLLRPTYTSACQRLKIVFFFNIPRANIIFMVDNYN